MHHATLYIHPTRASDIGFAQAAGLPGDIRIDFKTQANMPYAAIVNEHPQLVLRPFTRGGSFAYDIDINDPTGASGIATIPGSVMNDRFNIEVYTRNSELQPTKMIGMGRIDLTGHAYSVAGPLAPATYSIGPSGPAGPAGAPGAPGAAGVPGERGSRWYSGAGPPSIGDVGRVDGDMWLDETNGDVWRWDGVTASWVGYGRK